MVKRAEDVAKAELNQHRDIKSFFTKLMKDNIGMLAAFVSWSVLTSIVPIVVGLIAISSLFLRDPSTQATVEAKLSAGLQGVLSPATLHALVQTSIQHTGLLSIIGFLGVLWGGSNVGGSISTAFQAIFEVPGRNFFKEKLIDIVMIFVFTILMGVILLATAAGAFLNRLTSGVPLPGVAQFVIGTGISLLSAFLLFMAIYLVLPNIKPSLRFGNVWRGALLSAVLFQILTYIWPIYSHFSHFTKYGSLLASILVLTAWIYFFSMIVMIGAEVVAVRAIREAKSRDETVGPEPQDNVPQHKVLRDGHNTPQGLEVEKRPTKSSGDGQQAQPAVTAVSVTAGKGQRSDGVVERDPAFWLWAAAPIAVGTLAGLYELVRGPASRP